MESTYIYEMTESLEHVDEHGIMKVYGISISNRRQELCQLAGESCRIDGISPDYNEIKSLKDLMEKLELYPIHLYDVIEDFLS